jgi:hypothetical protein
MRKKILFLAGAFCFSCNNGKVDERKLDEAGEKLQKSVKEVVDTAGSKIKKLKEKLDKDRADTVYYRDSN